MIAIDDSSFKVIAFSENARERLGLAPQSVPSIEKQEILTIGTDVKTLFTPSSSLLLERPFRAREITLLNPLWVHSKNSGKPFYAILHRIDVGIVIDLEPARTEDPALSIAGAVQSQKLAVRAISKLRALPGGDIKLLCVVQNVRDLIGAFCFLQIASPELQQALKVQLQQEKKCHERTKELAYICHEIRNPLSGIRFANSLLEASDLTEDQKQLLETSAACEKQMFKIIKDVDKENIQEGSLEMENHEFVLGNVINVVVSQVMLLLQHRGLQLIRDIPEEVKTLTIYGDQARMQQVLTNFLLNMARHSPSPGGWVELQVRPTLKQTSNGNVIHIAFRIMSPGEGLLPELVQDMFHSSEWSSEEGLGLSMCRKILTLMNGEVQYIRE